MLELLQLGSKLDEKILASAASKCFYKFSLGDRNEIYLENQFFRFLFLRKKHVTDVSYKELRTGLNVNEEFQRIYTEYLQYHPILGQRRK